jgi:hypothetical protein
LLPLPHPQLFFETIKFHFLYEWCSTSHSRRKREKMNEKYGKMNFISSIESSLIHHFYALCNVHRKKIFFNFIRRMDALWNKRFRLKLADRWLWKYIECTLKTYVEVYFCKLKAVCKLLQDITSIKSVTGGNGCCT